MQQVIIGIDEAYAETGIAVGLDGEIKYVKGIKFKGCQNNTQKRQELARELERIVSKLYIKYNVTVVVERIRLHSHSETQFISQDYIKSVGAMLAVIIDTMRKFNVDVYSVDTRSWKAQVLGSSKSSAKKEGVVLKKESSVRKAIELGFGEQITSIIKQGKNKGKKKYDDNMADAICITLYGFLPKARQKLKLEKF